MTAVDLPGLADLPGCGKARLHALELAGILTVGDLLTTLPRRYEDFSRSKPLAELAPGELAVVSVWVMGAPNAHRAAGGRSVLRCQVRDESGSVTAFWFGQDYLKHQLKPGERLRLHGRLAVKDGRRMLSAPALLRDDEVGLTPVYSVIAGLPPRVLRGMMAHALTQVDQLPDPLPPALREKFGLPALADALRTLHAPPDRESLDTARRRAAFEELLLFRAAFAALGQRRRGMQGPAISAFDQEAFFGRLPFAPTGAQRRATEQILQDMAGPRVMSRLLQGDVGSGKTLVAAAAMVAVARAGHQAALMAPTELLARQHAKSLEALTGLPVVLLTGTLTAAGKRQARAEIAAGAPLCVGTHALLTGDTQFASLALVIADEQHRFGVQQRQTLADKGPSPHVLLMSATPIPRTLAFLLYGDLDISILDELPPGRTPVDTHVVMPGKMDGLWGFIRERVAEGRQAYVVCPAIEEEETGKPAAQEVFADLNGGALAGLRLGLLHGKLRPADKQAVMTAFAAGELDVLVATTVIEVGVDVPNAAVMAVLDADSFGLAQLHQLRGRVGRGAAKSYCFLCTARAEGSTRLRLLQKTADGFAIAQADLELRGPGELLGTAQSGLANGSIAGLVQDGRALDEILTAYEWLQARPELLEGVEQAAMARYRAGIQA